MEVMKLKYGKLNSYECNNTVDIRPTPDLYHSILCLYPSRLFVPTTCAYARTGQHARIRILCQNPFLKCSRPKLIWANRNTNLNKF